MMKIHVIILITKVSLLQLGFCCFINGKIKRSQKNLELDTNVAKNGQFRIFPQQAANSAAQHENPRAAEYCWHWLLPLTPSLRAQNKGKTFLQRWS